MDHSCAHIQILFFFFDLQINGRINAIIVDGFGLGVARILCESIILLFLCAGAISEREQVDNVTAETEDSRRHHNLWIYIVSVPVDNYVHPTQCLTHKPDNKYPNDNDTHHCAENLGSVIPIRVTRVRLPQSIPDSDETDAEADDVRKHVCCIGHNCDGVRYIATDAPDDHKEETDHDDAAQLALRLLRILKLLIELLVLIDVQSMELTRTDNAFQVVFLLSILHKLFVF